MRAASSLLWAAVIAVGLSVGSPTWWTGLATLAVLLSFVLVGIATLPGSALDADGDRGAATVLTLGLAAGIATSVVAWMTAAWLFKAPEPGTALLAAAAVVGGRRAWTLRADLARSVTPSVVYALLACALLALHLHARNEWVDGDLLRFTYRFDWERHLSSAGLMRTAGLPMAGVSGASAEPFAPASHRGLTALLMGVRSLTASSPYQAMRIVSVIGVHLIGGAALALASRWRLPACARVVAAISPLLWGSLVLVVEALRGRLPGLTDLYSKATVLPAIAGGASFHNQPQALAVGVTLAGLVALDCHRRSTHHPIALAAFASALIGVGALIKPSCVIVVMPAWLICLAATRSPLPHVLAALVPMGLVLGVGQVPQLGLSLPSGVAWTTSMTRLTDPDGPKAFLLLLGVGVPLMIVWLGGRFRRIRSRSYHWYDVALVALAGGALFWRLFEEGARQKHGNSTWPLTAALMLAAPWVVARVVRLQGHPRWLRLCAGALLALQLSAGAHYAWHYPTLRTRSVPAATVDTLTRLLAATPKDARLLIEPRLTPRPTWAYIDRPAPLFKVFRPAIDRELKAWRRISKGRKVSGQSKLLGSRDGVIVSSARLGKLSIPLAKLGFKERERVGGYHLFLKP